MFLHLDRCNAPSALHIFISSHRCLQRASRTPELHTSMPLRLHTRISPPALHTFKPQDATPTSGLHTSRPSHRYTYSAISNTSIPPRRYTYSGLPALKTSKQPVAGLKRSNAPYSVPPTSQARIAPPEFHTLSVPPHMQRDPSPPALQSSMPPCLHAYTAPARRQSPCLHSFTSLHLQRACRAPYLHASMSLRLERVSTAP